MGWKRAAPTRANLRRRLQAASEALCEAVVMAEHRAAKTGDKREVELLVTAYRQVIDTAVALNFERDHSARGGIR